MAITLRSGKEPGDSKEVENEKLENEKEVKVDKREGRKRRTSSCREEFSFLTTLP